MAESVDRWFDGVSSVNISNNAKELERKNQKQATITTTEEKTPNKNIVDQTPSFVYLHSEH